MVQLRAHDGCDAEGRELGGDRLAWRPCCQGTSQPLSVRGTQGPSWGALKPAATAARGWPAGDSSARGRCAGRGPWRDYSESS